MTFEEWYKSRYGVEYDKELIGDSREIAWLAATDAANIKHQKEIERLKAELEKECAVTDFYADLAHWSEQIMRQGRLVFMPKMPISLDGGAKARQRQKERVNDHTNI